MRASQLPVHIPMAGRVNHSANQWRDRTQAAAPPGSSHGTPVVLLTSREDHVKQTLFITARTGLYAVKTRVKGVGPQ